MTKVLTLFLLLTTQVINAEVFKCTSTNGKTIYQGDPCPSTTNTSTIAIETIDPEKVRIAQQKLSEQLHHQAEAEALAAKNMLSQRGIEALERNAQANEDRAETELLQLEYQTSGQQSDYYSSYPYYPYYSYYPRRRPKHRDHGPHRPGPRPPYKSTRAKKYSPGNFPTKLR